MILFITAAAIKAWRYTIDSILHRSFFSRDHRTAKLTLELVLVLELEVEESANIMYVCMY
jgi:hypothetical protein